MNDEAPTTTQHESDFIDDSRASDTLTTSPFPFARCGIAGALMGLANLVPGISGGTMILIMGLYEEFITAVADATRLKFSMRSILLLGIIGSIAVITIAALSGKLAMLVETQPVIMYGLFIGMTLGGAPLLVRMAAPWRPSTYVAMITGIGLMFVVMLAGRDVTPMTDVEKAERKARVEAGEFVLQVDYGRDVTAGVVGMSAMVLPGISGAYMLLILGRYEQILAAIALGRKYVTSMGAEGDATAFQIIIPVGIGVLISLVCVTNLLKWLLKHHERATVGCLLGIVIGSAITLTISKAPDSRGDWMMGAAMLVIGLLATVVLERVTRKPTDNEPTKQAHAAA